MRTSPFVSRRSDKMGPKRRRTCTGVATWNSTGWAKLRAGSRASETAICGKDQRRLEARTSGTQEFAQRRNVRAVRTYPARIYWQTKGFRRFYADAGIIQFRQAIAFDGHEAIEDGAVQRTGRTLRVPASLNDMKELIPISPVPHIAPLQLPWLMNFDAHWMPKVPWRCPPVQAPRVARVLRILTLRQICARRFGSCVTIWLMTNRKHREGGCRGSRPDFQTGRDC